VPGRYGHQRVPYPQLEWRTGRHEEDVERVRRIVPVGIHSRASWRVRASGGVEAGTSAGRKSRRVSAFAREACTEAAHRGIKDSVVGRHPGILAEARNCVPAVPGHRLKQERPHEAGVLALQPGGRPIGSRCCGLAAGSFSLMRADLPGTFAQVVQLGAADVAAALDLDAGDQRRVRLEGTFDALRRRRSCAR